jgi:hypothetical protein
MIKSKSRALSLLAVLISITSGLSGCASPATKDAMMLHSILDIRQHQKTVAIRTRGGSETGAMDSSNISNSAFAEAIEKSIIKNGLFAEVIHGSGFDYVLNVTIVNVSKPLFGASFTVDMETAWSLVNPTNKNVAMRESIKSSYTATMSDAFVGVTRLRLALEGAARENIHLGLVAISKLQLD